MRVCASLVLLASALPAQTVLRGTVRDMAGVPLGAVQVSARMDGTAIVLRRVTQGNGEYFFTLLAGAYSVTTDLAPDKYHIEVAAGGEAVLDLAVPASATISGRVLDDDRQPVKGAHVWLLTPEYRRGFLKYVQLMAYTDAKGAYTFSGRVESIRRYYVLAARPADGLSPPDIAMEDRLPIQVPTYYPSSAQFDGASPIVLQTGEQRSGVDIKLTAAPYYCVDGKIRDKEFTIEENTAGMPNARGRAGSNGVYRSCGLPAGSYRLVTADGAVEFTVGNADVHGADLSLPPAHLRLQLDWQTPDFDTPDLDAGAAEISAVEQNLMLISLGGNPAVAQGSTLQTAHQTVVVLTNASTGRAVFLRAAPRETEVPAGEYAVITDSLGRGADEIWYNGVRLLDPVLRVAPGVAGTLRVAASPSTCALNVMIADRSDAVAIVVPDYVMSVGQLARLAIHGGNNFKLPPGRYRVLASAQAIRWNVPDDLEKLLPALWQGELVDLDGQTPVQITVTPVTIY
jgi:hypothetical protein